MIVVLMWLLFGDADAIEDSLPRFFCEREKLVHLLLLRRLFSRNPAYKRLDPVHYDFSVSNQLQPLVLVELPLLDFQAQC
jgi:hypothetical protein